MPTPLRRSLRRVRRGLVYGIAVGLVLVAVLLGIASQLLPLAESNPARVAAWLSERAGRPVAFDHVETQWTRRGPLLQLDNLRVGEGEQAFVIGDAEMLVSIYAGLLPGTPFSELRLRGLDLTLLRGDDGRWRVRGLPGQRGRHDPLEALEGLGELQVIGGKLAVLAPQLGIDAHIPRINLRLRVQGDRVRAGMLAWPSLDAAEPLDVVLDFDRASGDGRAYAGSRRANLAAWSPLLRMAGVAVDAGGGRVQVWARLDDHRLTMLTLDAALRQVGLRESGADVGGPIARVDFERLEVQARWQRIDGGWRLDAPRLRIGKGTSAQVLDGLVVAGGEHFALLADRLDAGPLLAVAGLSNLLSEPLRHWLRSAGPQASLSRIEVVGHRGGPLHASVRIDALGFDAVGDAPGVQGLAGELHGDGEGFALRLDDEAPVRVEWPRGFGVAHTFRLDGTVAGWRQGEGWRIGSGALRIDGERVAGHDIDGGGIGLQLRGGLWWQGDGSRPWIDLAATVDDMPLPLAKGFWLHHRMSPRLVEWFDTALVAGALRDGRALVSGDLDDWPFGGTPDDSRGVFVASARIDDATLRFHRDWPAVEAADVDVRFVADSFEVQGTGRLGELRIDSMAASIDHYKGGVLDVRARGAGDAGDLLAVLKQSPLHDRQGSTLDNLSASGPARATLGFALPLQPGARARIDGTVTLDGAELADARWDLAFEQVKGSAKWSRSGFAADRLSVRHQGQPGRLSLRAGADYVRDRGNALEATLDATLDADVLLDRVPQLAWLKPHLEGRSPWTAAIEIPRSTAARSTAARSTAAGKRPPARLTLRSSLVGTALDLPAPLHKPAALALPTTVEASLPLAGGEVRVALGERMALRARSEGGRTGVRIALGRRRVAQPPPASGLVATGRANTLDAIEWIALVRRGGRSDGQGGSLPLRMIDVSAKNLRLLGGVFPDTRVIVAPAADGGVAVRTEGAALAGALMIERAPGQPGSIAGRFQRVHWRSADNGKAQAASADNVVSERIASVPAPAAEAREDDIDVDPASIPLLALEIDDLRIADARLGQASLRTRPTAGGLRIEKLRTRTDEQAIDLSGTWTGRGADARTRMAVSLDSDDVGALLAGFGFQGRVAGGNANVRFNAQWPGSPADFALGAIQGDLTLEARDGRLLEVEPGAGRVLGLLSIAELPRRLTLDFRDFFAKGFAFNTITGAIDFADGIARSDDLVIEGPAATIDIDGTANLRAQTYHQTIEVRPKAGNLLTAVGAIAGGPVGAAIGAAANAVLQKPLGEIAAKTYRVTGPWKDPEVEVIDREPVRAPRPEPAAAG